jgi:hypothetical protein
MRLVKPQGHSGHFGEEKNDDRIQTLGHPAHSLVNVMNTVPWLQKFCPHSEVCISTELYNLDILTSIPLQQPNHSTARSVHKMHVTYSSLVNVIHI